MSPHSLEAGSLPLGLLRAIQPQPLYSKCTLHEVGRVVQKEIDGAAAPAPLSAKVSQPMAGPLTKIYGASTLTPHTRPRSPSPDFKPTSSML